MVRPRIADEKRLPTIFAQVPKMRLWEQQHPAHILMPGRGRMPPISIVEPRVFRFVLPIFQNSGLSHDRAKYRVDQSVIVMLSAHEFLFAISDHNEVRRIERAVPLALGGKGLADLSFGLDD